MSGWVIVALMAILIWGVVQVARTRSGTLGEDDDRASRPDAGERGELEAARRELAELRERVKVLERIATDTHSGDAREQARIAAEIEALRDRPAPRKEQSE